MVNYRKINKEWGGKSTGQYHNVSHLYTLYVIDDMYLDVCKVLWKNIRFFFVKMYIEFLKTS